VLASRWSARTAALVAVVPLFAMAGCSGGKGSGTFATVSGVVTQDGAPLDGAKVSFYSTVDVDGKKSAYGALTDSTGKYLIAAVGKDPGIPPGMYKVTITKPAVKGGNLPPDYDAAQAEAAALTSGSPATIAALKDYENPNTTKLSVTLQPGKNENVDFRLK
jgi:hypothetical protein